MSKINIAIRNADKGDLEDVVKIFMEEYKKTPYNENWSKERAIKKVKNYFIWGKNTYVAVVVDGIAGFIVLETFTWDTEDRGMIDELVVSSKYQGYGVGSKLIETAEEYFKKKGIATIVLSVNKNARALNFYQGLDYKKNDYIELETRLK